MRAGTEEQVFRAVPIALVMQTGPAGLGEIGYLIALVPAAREQLHARRVHAVVDSVFGHDQGAGGLLLREFGPVLDGKAVEGNVIGAVVQQGRQAGEKRGFGLSRNPENQIAAELEPAVRSTVSRACRAVSGECTRPRRASSSA